MVIKETIEHHYHNHLMQSQSLITSTHAPYLRNSIDKMQLGPTLFFNLTADWKISIFKVMSGEIVCYFLLIVFRVCFMIYVC